MWGPYSRQPYSRQRLIVQIFQETLTGIYIAAADLIYMALSIVHLLGVYVLKGHRLRRFQMKVLRGIVEYSASRAIVINKIFKASFLYDAVLQTTASFYRSFAGTYKMVGSSLTKRMYVNLLGTSVWIASRLRLQKVFGWDYNGDFAPGDRIKVDHERLTVEINGENALHLIEGVLPFFEPGVNTLIYSDDEGNRTVRIRVVWKGRW